jgi:hypothetical protein
VALLSLFAAPASVLLVILAVALPLIVYHAQILPLSPVKFKYYYLLFSHYH